MSDPEAEKRLLAARKIIALLRSPLGLYIRPVRENLLQEAKDYNISAAELIEVAFKHTDT